MKYPIVGAEGGQDPNTPSLVFAIVLVFDSTNLRTGAFVKIELVTNS